MKKTIAIIGGGPASLMLAAELDEQKFDITIYERNIAVGRKFLVAGDGGFNLTHSEETAQFISRYTPAPFFEKTISAFSNTDLRNWFANIGIPTIVGSSKRVFPEKDIKPIEVLNAILEVLKKKNVTIKTQHFWKSWNDSNELLFDTNNENINVKADIVVFAMGGSSWKATGSDGSWSELFIKKGVEIIPFQASNCAYEIKWKNDFLSIVEGKSLKNISIKCENKEKKGEVVITKFGIEGGAVYALSPQIRKQLNEKKEAQLYIDMKPALTIEQIKDKFTARGNRSIKKLLIDRLNFNDTQIELLKTILTKEEFTDLELLSGKIKKLPLTITSAAPIDEAISTVGGVALTEINQQFELKKLSNNYVIGEMLDWDAPTGGYLLQACFSMGNVLAHVLNQKD